jgi:ABC-type amino acid transport system permease subunit
MNKSIDNAGGSAFAEPSDKELGRRIVRTMVVVIVAATIGSLLLAPWRVTTGFLVGGLLSLLNYRWLHNSTEAAFSVLLHGTKPRLTLAQYVLRYAVVGAIVFVAYQLNLVSLWATIVGLSSFVAAIFVEAFRGLYSAIFHREGII